MRAQDRWNEKAGYVSKSYKVNKNVADDFARSCKKKGVSQSGELFKFMHEYCKRNMKGEGKMRVTSKYSDNNEFAYMIEHAIHKFVYQYGDKDLEDEEKRILKECVRIEKGGKYDNCLEFRKDFYIPNAKEATLLEDFREIGEYVKSIYLCDIALMHLVIKGKLMPVRIRNFSEVELNINHSHGNTILTLQMDLFPFDVYVVI